jgi:adenylate cyclase
MDAKEVELVFLIADLSGYTALTEAHGNIQAATVVTRYTELAKGLLEPDARIHERVGDELVIVGEDAASIVRAALKLRDAVEREPLFPMVRSGIHAGTVAEHGASYFGSALNLAARVATYARGGQILCTEPVTMLAADLDAVAYHPLGPVRFKNVVDPVAVFEIVAGREGRESTAIDPVCQMQVWSDTAPARLPYGGRTYHFCSLECAEAFVKRPQRYSGSEH